VSLPTKAAAAARQAALSPALERAHAGAAAATGGAELAGVSRWNWEARFLWTGSIGIRKEVVGALPDGLRINWYFTEGHFVGPDHAGTLLPGAADLMRIRTDGVGVVNVTALLQLDSGARLYCSYGGVFDLGPDGYARALRDEFDAFPPFVVTPTFATSEPALAWLNRAQCVSVGRVDTKAMRIEYDMYLLEVRGRKLPSGLPDGEAEARPGAGDDPAKTVSARLTVNGTSHALPLDPRSSLLDVLREQLGLTGAKKGCDHGQCGACTVHLDGRAVLSCLTPAVQADGREVTTIEGLSHADGGLHTMQQAFIDHDALQCGYCTPGQIMAAVACVNEGHAGSPEQIREYMSGNICRCGAYVGIVAAVAAAATKMRGA
jgi:xanthine dehydrogenase YagT iron-sulfur-binding subunit